MSELNVSHASELVLLAGLVGAMAMWFWKICPQRRLAQIALGYGVTAFVVAAVLLTLILMVQGGMGHSVAPIVEALSHVEAGLS
ncbi:MAG: hypothetical protein ACSHYB_01900 [Roseibacillus sp.]